MRMMVVSNLVYMILTVQLGLTAWGQENFTDEASTALTQTDPRVIPTTKFDQTTTVNQAAKTCTQCSSWLCPEEIQLYAIIVAAAVAAILIISIVLCAISCCLWRRRVSEIHTVMNPTESVALDEREPIISNVTVSNHEIVEVVEPVPSVEIGTSGGITDVENCTTSAGIAAQEEPQDQPNESAAFLPPPDQEAL